MLKNLLTTAAGIVALVTSPGIVTADPAAQTKTAHEITFEAIDGKPMPLSQYAGRVLLVVNTASLCGFTKQYEGLQKLWSDYEAKGLVVIGVPSNDFGGQEPKSEGEIAEFCQGAFGVTFPLTAKVHVTGSKAHPFYAWARDVMGQAAGPRWSFHKYLVDGDGMLVSSFATQVKPDQPELIAALEAELAKLPKREAALSSRAVGETELP